MISKKIGIKHGNDNYGQLSKYILGGHEEEKCFMSWTEGCINNNNYWDSIEEIRDTQDSYTKSNKYKTYHLIVSFRPEDEKILTPQVFKDIEKQFAEILGYSKHQRQCGVHHNTANIHLHIAYNMIHPEKLTRHEPFRDYWKRDKLCRQLEEELGLVVDKGRSEPAKDRLSEKAATLEVKTGMESFETYVKCLRSMILDVLKNVQDWQELHQEVSPYGLQIVPYGNGLVFKNLEGKETVKASLIDRCLSLQKLESRLGHFVSSPTVAERPKIMRYTATPLHRSPERGQLFTKYQAGIAYRRAKFEEIKQLEKCKLVSIQRHWEAKRLEIQRNTSLLKKNRLNLFKVAKKHEAEELAEMRLEIQHKRDEVRKNAPFTSWKSFLQLQSESGNEVALAILRSQSTSTEPEISNNKDWGVHGLEQKEIRTDYAKRERSLFERNDLSAKGKTRLQAFLRMDQIMEEQKRIGVHLESQKSFIDGKGTVIFSLNTGDKIRDSGKEITFTPTEMGKAVAILYGKRKWGKNIKIENNRICRSVQKEKAV